ncbi:tRNA (adenosine(37)-N6)-threonylcarbamoyltransferase complex ATPase subunit type 1 TsaE, partial [Paracidovorax cattleyae]
MTAARHHPGIVESPSGTDTLQRVWRSEDDTAAFARALAAQPALANAFITLHGDLGAGKTTF